MHPTSIKRESNITYEIEDGIMIKKMRTIRKENVKEEDRRSN